MAHGLTAWCIDVDHRRRESLAYPTAASTTRCGLRPLGAGAPLLDFPNRLFGSAYPALIGGTFKMVQSLSASAMSSFSTAVVSADFAFRKPNRIRRRKNRNQTSSGSMFVMGGHPKP